MTSAIPGGTAPRPRWTDARLRERLPSPASAEDAQRAAPWCHVARPLDATWLPATLQVTPGSDLRLAMRWLAGLGAVLAGAVGLGLLLEGDTVDPVEAAAILGGLLALVGALAAALWWQQRGRPGRITLTLGLDRVRCETEQGAWAAALEEFAGLALRRRIVKERYVPRHGAKSLSGGPVFSEPAIERWWIELVHDDPERTLVLWATQEPMDDGLERVEALAQALRLPVLTTSGRSWLPDEDSDDDGNGDGNDTGAAALRP